MKFREVITKFSSYNSAKAINGHLPETKKSLERALITLIEKKK